MKRQSQAASPIAHEQRALWLWLRTLGADTHEADDVTQEALIIWLRKGGESWPGAQSGVFLRKTGANLMKNARRKSARRALILREQAAEAIWQKLHGDGEAGLESAQEALVECLETLSPKEREAIELSYREQASGKAIGEALGITASQVHQLLHQARKSLKACIELKLEGSENQESP